MKNVFFISLCVSAMFLACRSTKEVRKFNPVPMTQELTKNKPDIVFLDNSYLALLFIEETGQIFDSLGNGIKILPFSASIERERMFIADSLSKGTFPEKVGAGYNKVDPFNILIEYLKSSTENEEKILIVLGPDLLLHHRNLIPEIKKLIEIKKVEIAFLFLSEKGSQVFSLEQIELSIKNMHYPVQYIYFDGEKMIQWDN